MAAPRRPVTSATTRRQNAWMSDGSAVLVGWLGWAGWAGLGWVAGWLGWGGWAGLARVGGVGGGGGGGGGAGGGSLACWRGWWAAEGCRRAGRRIRVEPAWSAHCG